MQLTVRKSDGSSEIYLHTKVIGSIAAGLSESGSFEPDLAEHLAEAVTSFLRKRYEVSEVCSDEIHSMTEVVLSETGHGRAALALHEHRIQRQMRRNRTEVLYRVANDYTGEPLTKPWDKSVIVRDLVRRSLERELARAVAAEVETQALGLGFHELRSTLVHELVENQLWTMKQAEKSLTMYAMKNFTERKQVAAAV